MRWRSSRALWGSAAAAAEREQVMEGMLGHEQEEECLYYQDPLLRRKTMKLEEVSNLPTRCEGSPMTQTWYET